MRSVRSSGGDEVLVREPPWSCPVERDEVFDRLQLRAKAVEQVEVVAVGAQNSRPAVVQDVDEVIGSQPEVHRHKDGAELRHRVERFELCVRIRRDIRDAIAFTRAQPMERCCRAVASIEELGVRPSCAAVDHRFAVGVQGARAADELEWRERRLHRYRPAGRLRF